MINREFNRIARIASTYDPRTRGFGIGRTLISVAQIATLAFTDPRALMAPVQGMEPAPNCSGSGAISIYCLAPDFLGPELLRWVLVFGLAVVASGWRPRWTALPHFWISYSIAISISLPDGGESVARVICFLIIPIALADNRAWHWAAPKSDAPAAVMASVAFVFFWGVRLQMAGIYLHSAIGKLGVGDWVNGSAEYYFVRDGMFGVADPFNGFFLEITKIPFVTAGMTWGAVALEIVIAILFMTPMRKRRLALPLDIFLHSMIILTIGLWSFALIMIGSTFIAVLAETKGQNPSQGEIEDSDVEEGPGLEVNEKTPPVRGVKSDEELVGSP